MWRVDTAEEAVALRKRLEKAGRMQGHEDEAANARSARWSHERFLDAVERLGGLQQRLLVNVCPKPGISGKELVRRLEIDSEVALAGVISGLSKQLKPRQIELHQVLKIEVTWRGKKKTRRFVLEEGFLRAAAMQNWPEAWQ